jgi:5-formyltetrahydrofolate cyclo-ligase
MRSPVVKLRLHNWRSSATPAYRHGFDLSRSNSFQRQISFVRRWRSAVSFRAKAEPNLNAWAAQLLGDPTRVRCPRRAYRSRHSVRRWKRKNWRLSDLSLSPLDFNYAAQGSRDAQPSRLSGASCTRSEDQNALDRMQCSG